MPQRLFQRENSLALVEPVLCRGMPPDMHIALVLLDARLLCILFCQAQDRAITEALVRIDRCAAAFGIGISYENRVICGNGRHAPGCFKIHHNSRVGWRRQFSSVHLSTTAFTGPMIEVALPPAVLIGDHTPLDISPQQVRNLREPTSCQEVRQEERPISQTAQGVARDGCKEAEYFLDRKSTRLNSSHANISYAVF